MWRKSALVICILIAYSFSSLFGRQTANAAGIVYFTGGPKLVKPTDTVTIKWKVVGLRYVRIAWKNPKPGGPYMLVKADLPAEGQMSVPVSDVLFESDTIQFDLWASNVPDDHRYEYVAFVFLRVDLGIKINYFTVSPRTADLGDTVTLSWSVNGVQTIDIIIGHSLHSIENVGTNLPLIGTLNYKIDEESDKNSDIIFTMCLNKECSFSEQYQYEVTLTIKCGYQYFFGGNKPCPKEPPSSLQATFQPFEGGTMLWLSYHPKTGKPQQIFVLSNAGQWQTYQDTWAKGEETSFSEAPPSGRFLPVRGFGKLWSQDAQVRKKLSWATAPEQGYQVKSQPFGRCIAYSLPDGTPIFLNSGSKRWSTKRTIC